MIKILWRIIWGEPGPEKPKCAHDWETAAKTTCPPLTEMPDQYSDYSFDSEERIFRGITSVLRSCRKCGNQEVFELLGAPIQ
jgi:hypothetical protein